MCFDRSLPFHGSEESKHNPVLRAGHDLCRFKPAKHWSRTLADQFPGVFEANPERQLWGVGKERAGDPQSNQTYNFVWIALYDGISMMW